MKFACTDKVTNECHTQLNKLDIDLNSGVRTSVAFTVRDLDLLPLGLSLILGLHTAGSSDLIWRLFLLLTRRERQELTLRVRDKAW